MKFLLRDPTKLSSLQLLQFKQGLVSALVIHVALGDSQVKEALRSVDDITYCRYWYKLGYPGQNANVFLNIKLYHLGLHFKK